MPKNVIITDKNGLKWSVFNLDGGLSVAYEISNSPTPIIEVPEQIDGKPVVALSTKAFYKNELVKEVVLPASVYEIGEEAFFGCTSLEKINIPEKVEVISKWCFSYCTNLKSISGMEHINTFDAYCFYHSLSCISLRLEQELKFIGYYAFAECSFKQVNLGQIIQAEKLSFSKCANLTDVYFENDATAVPAFCFYGCEKLENVYLNNVKAIGEYAFGKCKSLRSFKLPSVISKIGMNVLFENEMECIIVPEKYQNIRMGELQGKYHILPTVCVTFDYNNGTGNKESKLVYYGEKIASLPTLETCCRKIECWRENPYNDKLTKEILDFFVAKFGSWFKMAYMNSLNEYRFDEPLYADLYLMAQWKVKEDILEYQKCNN